MCTPDRNSTRAQTAAVMALERATKPCYAPHGHPPAGRGAHACCAQPPASHWPWHGPWVVMEGFLLPKKSLDGVRRRAWRPNASPRQFGGQITGAIRQPVTSWTYKNNGVIALVESQDGQGPSAGIGTGCAGRPTKRRCRRVAEWRAQRLCASAGALRFGCPSRHIKWVQHASPRGLNAGTPCFGPCSHEGRRRQARCPNRLATDRCPFSLRPCQLGANIKSPAP